MCDMRSARRVAPAACAGVQRRAPRLAPAETGRAPGAASAGAPVSPWAEAALADLGERIVSVGSGRDALKFLLEHEAAVILLDVNMPEMDGFETATLIRQRKRNEHTPIIFLTANADEVQAARGYSVGAVDYLICPFAPDVLRTKVGVFVALSRAKDQVRREAEQRVALTREQAARATAEEQSSRLRVLVEIGGVLTRAVDGSPFEKELLALFVPLLAD